MQRNQQKRFPGFLRARLLKAKQRRALITSLVSQQSAKLRSIMTQLRRTKLRTEINDIIADITATLTEAFDNLPYSIEIKLKSFPDDLRDTLENVTSLVRDNMEDLYNKIILQIDNLEDTLENLPVNIQVQLEENFPGEVNAHLENLPDQLVEQLETLPLQIALIKEQVNNSLESMREQLKLQLGDFVNKELDEVPGALVKQLADLPVKVLVSLQKLFSEVPDVDLTNFGQLSDDAIENTAVSEEESEIDQTIPEILSEVTKKRRRTLISKKLVKKAKLV